MTRQPLPAASTPRCSILLAASLLALTLPRHASAATITVNTFAQGSVPGFCSFAEAIASINAGADTGGCVATGPGYGTNDTIILPFGTYPFTVADNGANGLPIITTSVTINGNGSTLARSGALAFRFFEVTGGSLTLNSLTLTGGNPGAGNDGGAVLDSSIGTLTITSCTFAGNTAQEGGAIFMSGSGGDLTVTSSTFTNNRATATGDADGGAIEADNASVTVTGSTFTNNRATSSAGDANGGGHRGGLWWGQRGRQ